MKHTSACERMIASALAVLFCLGFSPWGMAEAPQAGSVLFAKGVFTAKDSAGEVRILGKGTPLYSGDVLSTGPKSFALVEFSDGSRVTLRPAPRPAGWTSRATMSRRRAYPGGELSGGVRHPASAARVATGPGATLGSGRGRRA